jgi:hypothetical protein
VVTAPARDGVPGRSRLAEVKAVGPGYPWYGNVRVAPGSDLHALLKPDSAVVAPELLSTLHLRVGDALRVGGTEFTIAGTVLEEPDRRSFSLSLAPRVFVSQQGLGRARLLALGSRVTHRALFRLPPGGGASEAKRLAQAIGKAIGPLYEVETYAEAQPAVREGLKRAERFLGLVALLSLLVGGVARLANGARVAGEPPGRHRGAEGAGRVGRRDRGGASAPGRAPRRSRLPGRCNLRRGGAGRGTGHPRRPPPGGGGPALAAGGGGARGGSGPRGERAVLHRPPGRGAARAPGAGAAPGGGAPAPVPRSGPAHARGAAAGRAPRGLGAGDVLAPGRGLRGGGPDGRAGAGGCGAGPGLGGGALAPGKGPRDASPGRAGAGATRGGDPGGHGRARPGRARGVHDDGGAGPAGGWPHPRPARHLAHRLSGRRATRPGGGPARRPGAGGSARRAHRPFRGGSPARGGRASGGGSGDGTGRAGKLGALARATALLPVLPPPLQPAGGRPLVVPGTRGRGVGGGGLRARHAGEGGLPPRLRRAGRPREAARDQSAARGVEDVRHQLLPARGTRAPGGGAARVRGTARFPGEGSSGSRMRWWPASPT